MPTTAEALRPFIGKAQAAAVYQGLKGEEHAYFLGKLRELVATVTTMPKTYEQEESRDPMVYLHYFTGGADWYITERDVETEQHQAFGLADLFHDGGELGYISIVELIANGAELDFHFTPNLLSTVRATYCELAKMAADMEAA